MVVTRARSSRRHRSNRIDTPPRVVVVVDGDGVDGDGDGDGVDARATTRGRVGAAPVPMESIMASRATEPTHARARTDETTEKTTRLPPIASVRPRAHRRPLTRVVTLASSEMHAWERRARLSTTPSDDRHPPPSCVARWNTLVRVASSRRPLAPVPFAFPRHVRDGSHPMGTHGWKYMGASASSRVVQK